MKDHETWRELAALAAYDELDASETVLLREHLQSCGDCAALARDLRAGLGRLVRAPELDDLPAGWRERLEQGLAQRSAHPARALPVWLAAAASFLAGAALAWSLGAPSSPPRGEGGPVAALEGEPPASSAGGFARATPPPRARDRGSLPLLELYLRR